MLSTEDRVMNSVSVILGILLVFVTLYPFYLCVIYSFNDGQDAIRKGLYFFPRKFTLENYRIVLTGGELVNAFVMTVLRTVAGTVTAVFFTAMVAYGLSKQHLLFRRFYGILSLITLYFGGGLIPFYLLLRNLHLLNSFLVYIVPALYGYWNALLFIAFFRELPEALEDSAKMDGAGDFYVFLRIVVPLSKPVLATIALFVAVGHWNDWFASAYFVADMRLWTMPTILMRVMSSVEAFQKINEVKSISGANVGALMGRGAATLESVKFATMVVTVFPITVVYPFLQRYFVKGMLIGSIKM
jgi:putative aldouronate transport system permease protein